MSSSHVHSVAVVGDFGASAAGSPGAVGRFRQVDRDDLDQVLAELAPEIRLGMPLVDRIRFTRWRDFHPDGLIEGIPALARLVEVRDAAGDPQAMRNALAQLGLEPEPAAGARPAEPSGSGAAPVPDPALAAMADAELLDSILAAREQGGEAVGPSSGPATEAVEGVIREIVRESSDRGQLAERDQARAAIDAALARLLREVVRHPAFRALESSWASLRSLVVQAQTGDGLRILMAHYPQAALRAEVEGGRPVEQSALYRLLVESLAPSPGERALDLVVTDYAFDAGATSRRELVWLTELAARARLPLLAAATGSAAAVEQASEEDLLAWSELRRRPGAERVGLAAARLLLRLPYGADSDPIDGCAFEECPSADADGLLWGSGAFAVARSVLAAIAHTGRMVDAARFAELPGLPLHVFRCEAEQPIVVGPIDQIVTETRLEAWALMGLIPITGVRGADVARILALRSLAGGPLFAA